MLLLSPPPPRRDLCVVVVAVEARLAGLALVVQAAAPAPGKEVHLRREQTSCHSCWGRICTSGPKYIKRRNRTTGRFGSGLKGGGGRRAGEDESEIGMLTLGGFDATLLEEKGGGGDKKRPRHDAKKTNISVGKKGGIHGGKSVAFFHADVKK